MSSVVAVGDLNGCYDLYRNIIEKKGDTDFLCLLGNFIGNAGGRILLDVMSRNDVIPVLGHNEFRLVAGLFESTFSGSKNELESCSWYDAVIQDLGSRATECAEWLSKHAVGYLKVDGFFLGSYSPLVCYGDRGPTIDEIMNGNSHYYLEQLRRAVSVSSLYSRVIDEGLQYVLSSPAVQDYWNRDSGFSKDYIVLSQRNSEVGNQFRDLLNSYLRPVCISNSMYIGSGIADWQSSVAIGVKIENGKAEVVPLF